MKNLLCILLILVGMTSQAQVNRPSEGGTPEGTAVLSTGEVGASKFLREDGDGTSSWQAASGSGTVTSVAMTVPTGLSIAGSPITGAGTLALTLTAGYGIPTTANQTNWTAAYNDKVNSLAFTGTSTKTLTLTQQDAGTVSNTFTDIGFPNPMTTAGDIIYGGASGVQTRLPSGAETFVLTMGGTNPAWSQPDTAFLDISAGNDTATTKSDIEVFVAPWAYFPNRVTTDTLSAELALFNQIGDGVGALNVDGISDLDTLGFNPLPAAAARDSILSINRATNKWVVSSPKTEFSTYADPMTTRGDILFRNSSNVTARLPLGADNYVLTSDGTDAAWEAAGGGGATGWTLDTDTTSTPQNASIGTTNAIGMLTIQRDTIAETHEDDEGLILRNTTPADVSLDQDSPFLEFEGSGWASSITTSETSRWRIWSDPVQSTSHSVGILTIANSRAGGAWSTSMELQRDRYGQHTLIGNGGASFSSLDINNDADIGGELTSENSFAEMYDPATVISTASATTYYALLGWTAGLTNEASADVVDSMMIIDQAGTYLLNFSFSFTHNNSGTLVHICGFKRNGVGGGGGWTEFTNLETERIIGNGGDVGCVSGTALVTLIASDTLGIRVKADDTGNFTVNHGNFNATRIK